MEQLDDFAPDEQAILAVMQAETAAYLAKDFEAWAACWLHLPHVRRWNWFPDGGIDVQEGWEVMARLWGEAMRKFPDPVKATFRNDRMEMRVLANMAWVTYDQYSVDTGDPFAMDGLQHEMKIFERVEGCWKLSCISTLKPRPQSSPVPLVEVDGDCRVKWLNAAAGTCLAGHALLKLRAGKLLATTARDAARLKEAVKWAAGKHGYWDHRATRSQTAATNGSLPVFLGDVDEGRFSLVWVLAEDDRVLVSLDDASITERRLAGARLVFGLSNGQTRLAQHLLDGRDLAQAAALMQVSITTARTHLNRIFDKTGARNQAALVRVLLTAGSPFA